MSECIQSTIRQPAVATRFGLVHWLARQRRRLAPSIAIESLPDYLQRDLGFAGGHINPPRDPMRD